MARHTKASLTHEPEWWELPCPRVRFSLPIPAESSFTSPPRSRAFSDGTLKSPNAPYQVPPWHFVSNPPHLNIPSQQCPIFSPARLLREPVSTNLASKGLGAQGTRTPVSWASAGTGVQLRAAPGTAGRRDSGVWAGDITPLDYVLDFVGSCEP